MRQCLHRENVDCVINDVTKDYKCGSPKWSDISMLYHPNLLLRSGVSKFLLNWLCRKLKQSVIKCCNKQ